MTLKEASEAAILNKEKSEYQQASLDIWDSKYRLKDQYGNPLEFTVDDSFKRIAHHLSSKEKESPAYWEERFLWALRNGAVPAGRILSNIGASEYKTSTSTINCVVSSTIEDSMEGILKGLTEAGHSLCAGCGIGYDFSTLRPRGAFVAGVGASTSGPLPFMDTYDSMCFTISSSGGRRGAQMATFDVRHPDILEFIKAKREDGRLRQFNLSVLLTDDFMYAVKDDKDWNLIFPMHPNDDCSDWALMDYWPGHGRVRCRVYKTVKARDLWNAIMESTYRYAEPGVIFIDRINTMNNNYWCEEIRATNPCGEQPLPPYGSCLLGSVNLTKFVINPFTPEAYFDFVTFREVVAVFTRMLDNVVEFNGLRLPEQQAEILNKRRHGMGFMGLGSALAMLRIKYGDPMSIRLTNDIAKDLALTGWRTGVELAKEKGCAPIFNETADAKDLFTCSKYMQKIFEIDPELEKDILKYGCRFTHHSSIAPTGTIALSIGNNCSNGIEPSFAHSYKRNIIKEGKSTKEQVQVYSYEMLKYKEIFKEYPTDYPPEYFTDTDSITVDQHLDIQAAAQVWVDSSISKTVNIPEDYSFEDFKEVYMLAFDKGLKGCTTYKPNAGLDAVLVKDDDLKNSKYEFTCESGITVVCAGDEEIEYEGEVHLAANLYNAIKQGYYGKF